MYIIKLTLNGYRNYLYESVEFINGINVINGRNAQGKTNLIEAVFYLATGRSFRSAVDKDLINFNNESASIRAEIISSERNQTLEARFCRGRRRVLLANDNKLKKASELSGKLTTVQFGPDDLNMVKDGASVRRRLMDNCLTQLYPGYFAALTEFNKLYDNKTRILKDHYEKPSLLELLEDFNLRLAEQNAKIIKYRAAYVENLSTKAFVIHKEFSGGAEDLSLNYKTINDIAANEMSLEEIYSQLLAHQKDKYQAELRSGLCLSGSHKDDLLIEINGITARKFASQGQARTASISIKLAERDIHFDYRGEYPVLLLDDVLSELDSSRREYILSRVKTGQVIITCCEKEALVNSDYNKLINIQNGKVIEN